MSPEAAVRQSTRRKLWPAALCLLSISMMPVGRVGFDVGNQVRWEERGDPGSQRRARDRFDIGKSLHRCGKLIDNAPPIHQCPGVVRSTIATGWDRSVKRSQKRPDRRYHSGSTRGGWDAARTKALFSARLDLSRSRWLCGNVACGCELGVPAVFPVGISMGMTSVGPPPN